MLLLGHRALMLQMQMQMQMQLLLRTLLLGTLAVMRHRTGLLVLVSLPRRHQGAAQKLPVMLLAPPAAAAAAGVAGGVAAHVASSAGRPWWYVMAV